MGLIDREVNAAIQDMRIQEKASLEAEGEKKTLQYEGNEILAFILSCNGLVIEKCRCYLNISVKVDDWNPNGNNGRGEIRASVPDSIRFNNLLLMKVNKVDAALNEYHQVHLGEVSEEIISLKMYSISIGYTFVLS